MKNCFCFFLIPFLCFAAVTDLAVLFASDNNAERETLSLTDIPQQGAAYSFRFMRIRKNNWQMKIPGISKASAREDALILQASGLIRFLESNSEQAKIEFEIGILSAILDGETLCKIDSEKVIQVITSCKNGKTDVQLKKETIPDDDPYQQLLGVKSDAKKAVWKSFSDEQIQNVLKFIFRYPQDSMSDYAGKNRINISDKKIPLCIAPMQKILKEKDMAWNAGQITGDIVVSPKGQFQGINVYPLSLNMESSGIPGWDFQYQMTIQYSADEKNIPIHIHRRALEITDRNMPWDETLYAGNSIQVIRTDETEISMLPWN